MGIGKLLDVDIVKLFSGYLITSKRDIIEVFTHIDVNITHNTIM